MHILEAPPSPRKTAKPNRHQTEPPKSRGFRFKKRYLFFLAEPLLLLGLATALAWLFGYSPRNALLEWNSPVPFYLTLWLIGSVLLRKDRIKPTIEQSLNALSKKNIAIHVVIVLSFYYLDWTGYKLYFLCLFAGMTLLEMFGIRLLAFNKVLAEIDPEDDSYCDRREALKQGEPKQHTHEDAHLTDSLRMLIIGEIGEAAFGFVQQNMSRLYDRTLLLSTTTRFNIEQQPNDAFTQVVNLKPINKVGRINKFFEAVNEKLPMSGKLIGFAETAEYQKIIIYQRYPKGVNYLVYAAYAFWHRVCPKIPLLQAIYFIVTAGKHRELSKAEAFGRLYSCGFEITGEEVIAGRQFFVAQKVKAPAYDENPTYGPLIRLQRTGKNGKPIKVYKFRSMYPYSEYLQEYVYQLNQLDNGGKFKDDFRVTPEGKLLRKFWLDELPMFINFFKGEMKLVGVRPLSKHYFSLYSEELQALRIKHKPGLLPPFYVDMPDTLDEIMASEMKYLQQYEKNPFLTDWKYFWGAVHNILIRKARSK